MLPAAAQLPTQGARGLEVRPWPLLQAAHGEEQPSAAGTKADGTEHAAAAVAAATAKRKLKHRCERQKPEGEATEAAAVPAVAAEMPDPAGSQPRTKKKKVERGKRLQQEGSRTLAAAAAPAAEGQQPGRAATGQEEIEQPARKKAKKGHRLQQQAAAEPRLPAAAQVPALGAWGAQLSSAPSLPAAPSGELDPAAGNIAASTEHAAATAAAVTAGKPPSSRKRWREEDEEQLRLLATSAEHRQAVLGSAELDWVAIGAHLGRSSGAVQGHWLLLNRQAVGQQQQPAGQHSQWQQQLALVPLRAGALPGQQPRSTNHQCGGAASAGAVEAVVPVVQLGAADNKRWEPEEVANLLQLAEDEQYRLQMLGASKRNWQRIGRYFGVGEVAARDRYYRERYKSSAGPVSKPAPHMPGLFVSLVETILRSQPDRTATCSHIYAALEQNPQLFGQLLPEHFQVEQGQKSKPRWHLNVRAALRRHHGIEQTGMRVGREVQWRLLPDEQWLEERKRPRKKRPAPTATPLLGKNSRGPN